MKKEGKHPCFDIKAKHTCARAHLPVAPECNIKCNYCNRKYDCVNESRPGVTSTVLTPYYALEYVRELKSRISNLTVLGIAGPGDPFAEPEKTLETLRLISAEFPELIFCLSSNGLNILPYIDEIAEIGVSHVTITVNAVDPEIGAEIYPWIRYKKKVYRGEKAAEILLENQINAIKKLKEKGITVKVNTIVLPGINDSHIEEVAKRIKKLGVDIMNCIPICPVEDTAFEYMSSPSSETLNEIRKKISFMPQMTHCARCRADAVGLLGEDNKSCFEILKNISGSKETYDKERPYVAVTTYEGLLVNCHLGEAEGLHIFQESDDGAYSVREIRLTPPSGGGDMRWNALAESIEDCRALLVGGLGDKPLSILEKKGVKVIEMSGLIENGLNAVYKGHPLKTIKPRDMFKCGSECSGQGLGCG
jgi:nitrogen fixation protein NifB